MTGVQTCALPICSLDELEALCKKTLPKIRRLLKRKDAKYVRGPFVIAFVLAKMAADLMEERADEIVESIVSEVISLADDRFPQGDPLVDLVRQADAFRRKNYAASEPIAQSLLATFSKAAEWGFYSPLLEDVVFDGFKQAALEAYKSEKLRAGAGLAMLYARSAEEEPLDWGVFEDAALGLDEDDEDDDFSFDDFNFDDLDFDDDDDFGDDEDDDEDEYADDEGGTTLDESERLRLAAALGFRVFAAAAAGRAEGLPADDGELSMFERELWAAISRVLAELDKDEGSELIARIAVMASRMDPSTSFEEVWEKWGGLSGWRRQNVAKSGEAFFKKFAREAAVALCRIENVLPRLAEYGGVIALEHDGCGPEQNAIALCRAALAETAGDLVDHEDFRNIEKLPREAMAALPEEGFPLDEYIGGLKLALDFSVLMRPKDDPEALVLVNIFPAVSMVKRGEAPGISIELQIPAELLDTFEGRLQILSAMHRLQFLSMQKAAELVDNPDAASAVFGNYGYFGDWKPYATYFYHLVGCFSTTPVPENESAAEFERGARLWALKDGRTVLRRSELILMTNEEYLAMIRVLSDRLIPMSLAFDFRRMRLEAPGRQPIVRIFEAGTDAVHAPTGLPRTLASSLVWTDAALLSGDAPLARVLKLEKQSNLDSGWMFLSDDASFDDLKYVTVTELAGAVPDVHKVLMDPPKKQKGRWAYVHGALVPEASDIFFEIREGFDDDGDDGIPGGSMSGVPDMGGAAHA